MLVAEGIAELVADTASGADNLVNIAMGMTVNPVLNWAIGDKVKQLDRESSVDSAALKHRVSQQL